MMKWIFYVILGVPAVLQAQIDVNLAFLAGGYTRPCEIVHAGDERLFVVEQTGNIKILYTDGSQEANVFLNITDRVDAQGGEKGLLGLAFPPDFCSSGKFYVNYTNTTGNQLRTRVSRFTVDANNENLALSTSEEIILEFNQDFSNHNGGKLEFGPDGYLYIATGDGGSGGDPNNNGQSRNTLLGKLLRIDVSTEPYSIPADNPFVGIPNTLPEIWAYGLRNPWKFAFDEATGQLFIGDVGQNSREEISYAPTGGGAGNNYGWRCYEGFNIYDDSECGDVGELVDPIFDYGHASIGSGSRCSVTGGRVYRGPSFTELQGHYIFADYCSGEYWTISGSENEWETFYGGPLAGGIVAFGSDVWGELYAVRGSAGTVSRVLEASDELLTQIYMPDLNTLQSDLDGETYIWTLNGEIIEGENGPSITPQSNGFYGLTVLTSSGCSIVSQSFEVITVSTINRDRVRNLKLFPNPAYNEVKLEIDLYQSISIFTIEIYAPDGKLVEILKGIPYQALTTIPLGNIKQGLYFVLVRTQEGDILARQSMVVVK